MTEYRELNRAFWDERAPAHAASADYGFGAFVDPSHLSNVVRFDRGCSRAMSETARDRIFYPAR